MKERSKYMLCCGCGYAVKMETMFMKAYYNTALCLCKKCARELKEELTDALAERMADNG